MGDGGWVVGVDLASRYSAAVVLDSDATVLKELVLDTGVAVKPPDPQKHLRPLFEFWNGIREFCDVDTRVVLEDIHPHAISGNAALRLSGSLLTMAWLDQVRIELVRVPVWQSHFGYKHKKGVTTKAWAKVKAGEYGYNPPVKGKAKVDLRDAYLIARWALETRHGELS